jgi:hypothetical protein
MEADDDSKEFLNVQDFLGRKNNLQELARTACQFAKAQALLVMWA